MRSRVDVIRGTGAGATARRRLAVLGALIAAGLPAGSAAAECPLAPAWGGAEEPSLSSCVPDEAAPARKRGRVLRLATKASTDRAYSKDFWNARFGHHALDDFPGYTTVATGVVNQIFATDFDPTATTLYALDSGTLDLGTVSQSTGAFTAIGPSIPSVAGHELWSGLAIHPVSGTLYASAIASAVDEPYGLYTIDADTGLATLIGVDASSTGMIAIAIDCAGQMYGHDIVTDAIYQIDTATGALTLVGPTGVNSNFAQGMDFDNTTGKLYAWTYQGGGANRYGTIDLATGALTTLSSSNPTGEFEGAVENACAFFADGFESGDTSAWSAEFP